MMESSSQTQPPAIHVITAALRRRGRQKRAEIAKAQEKGGMTVKSGETLAVF